MKKRKFKLFASVAAFALTGAMMTFGVLAAASHAVNVTTNVGFTSNGANGTITVTANGTTATEAPTETRNFTPSGLVGGDIALGDLVFAQTHGEAGDITISFTITKVGGNAANILETTISVYNEAAPASEEDLTTQPLTFDQLVDVQEGPDVYSAGYLNNKLVYGTPGDASTATLTPITEGQDGYNNVLITCSVEGATGETGAADNTGTADVNEASVTITFTIHVVDSGIAVENIPLYFHVEVEDTTPSVEP